MEKGFQPTPEAPGDQTFTEEDRRFLDGLDERFTIEEWKVIFRKVVNEKYRPSIDNGSKTPAEMIVDFQSAFSDPDNPPEKQQAVEEFLQELREAYQC